MLRRDCRHHLRHGHRDMCRHVWIENIRAEPKELSLGCDTNGRCPHYAPATWKRSQLPETERRMLEADDVAEVLEWDDSEDTRNELPPPK